jgi:hypothetical protein
MFNMGGPIKQGVMQGIREPYKHGGPTGTGLVGDQRYPKTSGREHHAFFIPPLWAAATGLARFAPSIYRAAQAGLKAGRFGTSSNLGRIGGAGARGAGEMGTGHLGTGRALMKYTGAPTRSIGQKIKGWFTRDPLYQAAKTGAGWTGAGLQKAGKGIKWAGTTPSGLLTTGLPVGWFGGKALYDKLTAEEKKEVKKELKKKKGDKDYGPYTKDKLTLTQEQREAKAKADKEKRINALLDTMGYDKARKTAAYDALIDAGRMVSERGTLEAKNIGRELIDPIVAATSARFDKPEQIREAVGLMQTKADIQKEMTKDETALANQAKRIQIAVGEKTLAGATLEETAAALYTRHGSWPSGESLAYLARNKNIPIVGVVDTGKEEVADSVAYMENKIKQLIDAGTEMDPGNYVVGKDIIIVDAEGNVRRR